MRVLNEELITSGDMSEDITSDVVELTHMGMAAIHARYAGSSPTGDLKLQASVDGENFIDLGGSYTVAVSADGQTLWQLSDIGYSHVRVFWNSTSGTGSLNVVINAKGF